MLKEIKIHRYIHYVQYENNAYRKIRTLYEI